MATDTLLTVRLTDEWAKSNMARAVPGSYWNPDVKAHVVDNPTPRAAAVALRLFPDLAIEYPELQHERDKLLQDVRPFDNATPLGVRVSAATVRSALQARGQDFYDFQGLDLGYVCTVLEAYGGAYIGWERGLGKTLGAAAVIDELRLSKVLVVCPNTAKAPVWGAELARFLPDHEVIVLRNTKTQRERDLLTITRDLAEWGRPFVLVTHYEALDILHDRKRSPVTWKHLGEWDMIVADEAHRISNPKAKMTRALKKIPTKRKLALSGSIIQNHAEELFSPLQWLYPDRYRSKWRDWNDRFLDYVENGYTKMCVGVKPEAIESMRKELGVFMVYRRKEDELDLPNKTEQTLFVELSPRQRKAYDELVTQLLTQLDDGTVVKATDGLVLLTRLRQIATGLDLLGTGVTDASKADLTIDMIEDNEDEAFVVFTWFKANAQSIFKRLVENGTEAFVVTGDTSHKRRNEYIEAFQAGAGRVFIGTLSTLGESVNLQRANNAIFLDRSWNPGTNIQAQDRIYRIGQDKPVTITHLIAKDTVDEYRVLPTIANKEALRRLILGGL